MKFYPSYFSDMNYLTTHPYPLSITELCPKHKVVQICLSCRKFYSEFKEWKCPHCHASLNKK